MEIIYSSLEIADTLGLTVLNLVLIAMLYFMGAQHGMFPKFWKTSSEVNDLPATRSQMERLSNYYNHDTTEILLSINQGIEKVHKAVENLDDRIKELHMTHEEWEKYGIPTRQK